MRIEETPWGEVAVAEAGDDATLGTLSTEQVERMAAIKFAARIVGPPPTRTPFTGTAADYARTRALMTIARFVIDGDDELPSDLRAAMRDAEAHEEDVDAEIVDPLA